MSTSKASGSIACLLITHLPVKAERQRFPALRDRPLLLVEHRGQSDAVYDHSPEVLGVSRGMELQEAISKCPDATVLQANGEYYDDVFDRMAHALEERCPTVERGEKGCLYAALEGIASVYGGEASLIASLLQVAPAAFEPRIGVAAGKITAYVAAATASTGRAVKAPGDTAAFLSSHAIDMLPISPGNKERLRRWGVGTMGRLASMPLSSVQARLGSEGRYAWELANGMEAILLPDISLVAA